MVTDVLAVEIRKYVADGRQAYVFYVIVNTAKALDRKSGGAPLNYQGKLNFEEVIKLCEERRDNIVIGYNGGIAKFSTASLPELQARGAYKWDLTDGGIGTKYGKNWPKGGEFFKIVSGKQSASN
jgi:hypothetical protein